MRNLTILLLALTCYTTVCAQRVSVVGSLKDTADNRKLEHAVIQLVRASDSVIVAFTRADQAGKFSISSVDTGKYLVWATYPKYADYVEEVDIGKLDVRFVEVGHAVLFSIG